MSHKLGVVVTTIQPPTDAMKCLGQKLDTGPENNLFIIGDAKGPEKWALPEGCNTDFWSLEAQSQLGLGLSKLLKINSYARKNLGYLLAMGWGAECIYETDDDTFPKPEWRRPGDQIQVRRVTRDRGNPWVNPYIPFEGIGYYGGASPFIWPRGYPIEEIASSRSALCVHHELDLQRCPVQNGLVDKAPDVDALWRLLHNNPEYVFRPGKPISIDRNFWAPFNSQNTWWFPEAFPLMYLPSYCSIRMVDIWRGFVAQWCLWQMGYNMTFREADVIQDRNAHDLHADFRAEMDGYTRTKEFCGVLEGVKDASALSGTVRMGANLARAYIALVRAGFFDEKELALVDAWLEAVDAVTSRRS